MISNDIIMLKLIDSGASLDPLRKLGLSHSQIAALIQKQIDNGFVEMSDYYISLTDSGRNVLLEHFNVLSLKDRESWILPQKAYYAEPLSLKKVYLPKKI